MPLWRSALAMAWGLLGYILAVRSLVYLVCFLENFGVAKTVDSGPVPLQPGALAAGAVDAGLFLLFALAHSLLARRPVKRALARAVPPPLERSTYGAVSGALLSLLFWQWRPLPEPVWTVTSPLARAAVQGLGIAGWVLAVVALRTLGHARLFGLAQAWRYARGAEPPPDELVRRGVYGRLRHPLSLAFLIGAWATPAMSQGRLLFATVAALYIAVGVRFEERDLARRFGEEYERYRRQVPAFLIWCGLGPRARRPLR